MSVLITGGGGGLGSAIADQFAQRGLSLALVDQAGDRAEAVAERIRDAYGVPVAAFGYDISTRREVEACWREANDTLGPIDTVVNSAGVFAKKPFLDLSDDEWRRTQDVNLTSAFVICQVAARCWIDQGIKGSIVNVASIAAFTAGLGGAVDYGSSKAGLIGLTIHLAVDLGPHGIRSNAVAPASFRSGMTAERYSVPGAEETMAALSPLRRIGEPEDVAKVIAFLALDATYVNGVVVNVDGGMTCVM